MHRSCVRAVAATLVILSLSFWVRQATRAGQVDQDRETRIHQKMERLQALVQQRQQEGADLQPVGELMQGLPPLMEQQKFAEAEALLDRALELANKLGSPAQTGVPPRQPSPIASTKDAVPTGANPKMAGGREGPPAHW